MATYPKRLIEVDLPIKRISAHARREKSIRHGHINTLHIWWARRPLAACRAVLCASLWPDPADELCPQAFRHVAADLINAFAYRASTNKTLSEHCSAESLQRWIKLAKRENRLDPTNAEHLCELRSALLDVITDFSNWDSSTISEYLETARLLTQFGHLSLTDPGFSVSEMRLHLGTGDLDSQIQNLKSKIEDLPRPLVVDPFAGGGAIPLEALRVGADAFASDLNPVAVLLNKVVLEYIPKYGYQLADEVRKWGEWIKEQAEKELAEFYPKDPDGATPIAYLWARTIKCEGPGCGVEVPLVRSLWLAKRGANSVALRLVPRPRAKRVDFEIIESAKAKDVGEGTVKRGSATCPVCGYTTPVASVRKQLKARRGGAADARVFAVVTTKATEQGRFYRTPTEQDLGAVRKAAAELETRKHENTGVFPLVPDERTPSNQGHRAVGSLNIYGMDNWGDLFTQRQLLLLTTLTRSVHEVGERLAVDRENEFAVAVQSILACAVDREAEHSSSLCRWNASGQKIQATFGRQALPMMWDYAETNPFGGSVGSWGSMMECVLIPFETTLSIQTEGHAECANVVAHLLPDDAAQAFVTDPPYYDAVPYADLADFFYIWLKRSIGHCHPDLFQADLTPKEEQAIVWHPGSMEERNSFERKMSLAMAEGRRVLSPDGIGVVIFAHKSTAGWEAQLQAMVDAGWIVTGSWPIDTEMGSRMNAMETASLVSSVHLICRPRENPDGSLRKDSIGDWRDILAELPKRIHEWMPRLAAEGVVGADAIFACLGPALEIFSRYSRVEKASGEQVTLKEYLEYVWAAVAKEALNMIFEGADATGFEEDARLTAMWLWTLSTKDEGGRTKGPLQEMKDEEENGDEEPDESEDSGKSNKLSGYLLEYDAARKIGQGLGAHLERLTSLVEVKGDKARLLPVSERARHLFGKDEGNAPAASKRKQAKQLDMFETVEEAEEQEGGWGDKSAPKAGDTILDRVHQSMILFAAGRSEALKRFLLESGAGADQRFWRLAQALSALYPSSSDEKRWVDGVLAKKKGLGF